MELEVISELITTSPTPNPIDPLISSSFIATDNQQQKHNPSSPDHQTMTRSHVAHTVGADDAHHQTTKRHSLRPLLILFLTALSCTLLTVYALHQYVHPSISEALLSQQQQTPAAAASAASSPPLGELSWSSVLNPLSLLRASWSFLRTGYELHFMPFCLAHGVLFLFLQTFAVPGTFICNLLAGALSSSLFYAYLVCLWYNLVGGLFLYWIGRYMLRPYIEETLRKHRSRESEQQEKAAAAAQEKEHDGKPIPVVKPKSSRLRDAVTLISKLESMMPSRSESTSSGNYIESAIRLILYLSSIRMFPFTPNWLVTLICGYVCVPEWMFTAATLIGLTPYNFLSVKAGTLLRDMLQHSDQMIDGKTGHTIKLPSAMDTNTTLTLVAVAFALATLPTLYSKLIGSHRKSN